MPKIEQEVYPERDAVLAARLRRARERLTPLARSETAHATKVLARRAAVRCGMPNTEVDAVETTHGWVGVVILRPDQRWMEPIVREQGCRVGDGESEIHFEGDRPAR